MIPKLEENYEPTVYDKNIKKYTLYQHLNSNSNVDLRNR